ncbi:MAG: biotin/lipoyl-containing protein [Dethiobacteria bacterium]
MKRFKVTVDGQTYDVLVEEVAEKPGLPRVEQAVPPGVRATEPETGSREAAPAPPVKEEKAPQEKIQPEKPAAPEGDGFKFPAPIPGPVIEVKVQEGDRVNAGDVLLIIEAMKMENEITVPQGGVVSRVLVKKGDTVNTGDTLVILK